jgi:ferrous iron transport protein B
LPASSTVIALIGNPNSGKSSLFNQLTGLRQKTGNFPGVTVDKKVGLCKLDEQTEVRVIDLPGTYSLYPKSLDEKVVLDILTNPQSPDYPTLAVVVVDASNLKRNLLLYTEIRDLGIPVVLAINMLDVARQSGLVVHTELLKKELQVPIVEINARVGEGLGALKKTILQTLNGVHQQASTSYFIPNSNTPELIHQIKEEFSLKNDYLALHYAQQHQRIGFLSPEQKNRIDALCKEYAFGSQSLQAKETIARYQIIGDLLNKVVSTEGVEEKETFSTRVDQIILHRFWGYFIFFGILFLIFQAIFAWASYPMDWIDGSIASLNAFLQEKLPESPLTSLLTDGLIAGMGGVLIFIPQIAILFAFISILEESGYMSRVVFIMDKIMRKFGLNGKSVVPLISGAACAVPAIMATRNIGNWKDRLITIFVTPLISCSARIPIYTILIALVVPEKKLFGMDFLNLQGFALMALYLLGFAAALLSAWVMKLVLRTKEKSYFIMELPTYKMPRWDHVGLTILEKVKAFVWEAGKIIVAISIVLWVLASYGPGDQIQQAEARARQENTSLSPSELDNLIASEKLEASYAGHFGKFIEPVIKPLGYDWKIGIALITSFAAREVFVGTMSTIYSLGSETDDDSTIKNRMRSEINPATGEAMYTPALAFSLLIFYAFAMQCMSTLAVVHRETKSWRWPLIQLVYMTSLAYISAFLVYNTLQ